MLIKIIILTCFNVYVHMSSQDTSTISTVIESIDHRQHDFVFFVHKASLNEWKRVKSKAPIGVDTDQVVMLLVDLRSEVIKQNFNLNFNTEFSNPLRANERNPQPRGTFKTPFIYLIRTSKFTKGPKNQLFRHVSHQSGTSISSTVISNSLLHQLLHPNVKEDLSIDVLNMTYKFTPKLPLESLLGAKNSIHNSHKLTDKYKENNPYFELFGNAINMTIEYTLTYEDGQYKVQNLHINYLHMKKPYREYWERLSITSRYKEAPKVYKLYDKIKEIYNSRVKVNKRKEKNIRKEVNEKEPFMIFNVIKDYSKLAKKNEFKDTVEDGIGNKDETLKKGNKRKNSNVILIDIYKGLVKNKRQKLKLDK